VSTTPNYSLEKCSSTGARYQISSFAETYVAAKALADAFAVALEAMHATDITNPTAFIENELDLYEPDTFLYHVPLDFFLWY
jgi:hypothetical protein